jgi:DNA repair exonuclease SbcCD nuclease subunit
MIFSHISDTHLGFTQYGLVERENDVYDSFNEAIDVSIKDHVDFVIFAGDIFHIPNPSGNAILQMANALRRLKEKNIESFFVLGEHDISRISSAPVSYVYHNLRFANYIGGGKQFVYKNILLIGFDKIRKSEIASFAAKFDEADKTARAHNGHKILVMHQGISEISEFAGEVSTADLPKSFTYYAMGHLHDKFLKHFPNLEGPVAYPGSIEVTSSEGIKDSPKGFYEVDISASEPNPSWIKLSTRPHFSEKVEYKSLQDEVTRILDKMHGYEKKPVVELRISGNDIKVETVQTHIAGLLPHTLHCVWRLIQGVQNESSILLNRPANIDDELFRRAVDILGPEVAVFAMRELLPALAQNRIEEANRLVLENFEQYKRGKA